MPVTLFPDTSRVQCPILGFGAQGEATEEATETRLAYVERLADLEQALMSMG